MPHADLISDFALLAETPYDLDGLWKAKAYDEIASLYSGLTRRIAAAPIADRPHLLAELTPRAKGAAGTISKLLCGLIVARLICTQEDGWIMHRGRLAEPTETTLERLADLKRTLSDSAAGALFVTALHQFWSGNRVEGFAAFRALGDNPDFKALVRDDLRGAPTCHPDALAETGAASPEPPRPGVHRVMQQLRLTHRTRNL